MTSDSPQRVSLEESVAEAIYQAQRKIEIDRLGSFEFDPSVFMQAVGLMLKSSERERVIISFSLISTCMDAAIRYHFSHSSKTDQKELLDNLGPLATDAARLKLLRVMGWLPTELSDGIEGIRRLRNKLSHSLADIDLNPKAYIPAHVRARLDGQIDAMSRAAEGVAPAGTLVEGERAKTFTGYAILLAAWSTESIVCAPSRDRLGLPKTSQLFGMDDGPPWAPTFFRTMSRALLTLSTTSKEP